MAPLGESTMIWSELVTVLIYACCCIPMTLSTNVQCIDDINKCRYQCPLEEVHKYCPSPDAEINDEFCCPGHFRTITSQCQLCNVLQFMPDVNNCCRCLPCTECDNVVNDTIAVYCSPTSNVVCTSQTDPAPTATSSCPLMEPSNESSTSSKEVTTPEVIDFTSTPRREPQESQSEWTSLEIFFFVIVVPFFVMLCLLCLVCIYCCLVYKLAGNYQPDVASKEWEGVILMGANQPDVAIKEWKDVTLQEASGNDQPYVADKKRKEVTLIIGSGNDDPDVGDKKWKEVTLIVPNQPDVADKRWNEVTLIVAKKVVSTCTCTRFRNTCRAGNGGGGGKGHAAVLNEGKVERIDVGRGPNLLGGHDEIDDADNPPNELNQMLPNQDHEVT